MGDKGDKRRSTVEGKPRRSWLPRSRLEYLYYLLGALVALFLLLSYVGIWGGGGDTTVSVSPAARATPPAKLEAVSLLVEDNVDGYPYSARLELTLHNNGGKLVVVDGARFEIRHVYHLPLCYTQGDLPVSNSYGVRLPADAEAGDVVERPLHQQIGPDEADRLAFNFNVEDPAEGKLDGVYLFDVDVELVNDGPRSPLPVGRATVSLPEVPYPPNFIWFEGDGESLNETYNVAGYPVREAWAAQMPCWRSNTELLRQAVDSPAEHSVELAKMAEGAVTPTYAALAAGTR